MKNEVLKYEKPNLGNLIDKWLILDYTNGKTYYYKTEQGAIRKYNRTKSCKMLRETTTVNYYCYVAAKYNGIDTNSLPFLYKSESPHYTYN